MPAPTAVPTTPATAPHGGFAKMSQLPELAAKQKSLNSAKKPAFIPNAIKRQSQETQLYIFNVGPKPQEGSGASYGRVMIPSVPGGKVRIDENGKEHKHPYPGNDEYSDAFVVQGLPHEYYNKEGNTLDAQFHGDGEMEEPGFDWACQAIGGFTKPNGQWEGKFLHPSGSLEKFGVGISRTWPPSPADIALAKKKMLAEYAKLVQQANEAHAVGKFASISTDDHFVAARALGKTEKDCRWMEFSAAAAPVERQTKNCPSCAEEILIEAKKCKHCGEFITKQ